MGGGGQYEEQRSEDGGAGEEGPAPDQGRGEEGSAPDQGRGACGSYMVMVRMKGNGWTGEKLWRSHR